MAGFRVNSRLIAPRGQRRASRLVKIRLIEIRVRLDAYRGTFGRVIRRDVKLGQLIDTSSDKAAAVGTVSSRERERLKINRGPDHSY